MSTRLPGGIVGAIAPSGQYQAVAPSANNFSPSPCRALYIGGTGDLEVVSPWGDTVVFRNVQGGTVLPLQIVRVTTNTTASYLVALY